MPCARVSSIFFAMTSAHTNARLTGVGRTALNRAAASGPDIWSTTRYFPRESVWQDREALDAESRRLVEVTHQRFVLAGARLNDAEKAELKDLNTQVASLISQFNQRLLAADRRRAGGGLYHQLEGLSAEDRHGCSGRRR